MVLLIYYDTANEHPSCRFRSMMTFTGSHGTCRSRGLNIIASGFRLDNGRHGKGAYFWRDGPMYIELAKEWFYQEHEKGQYDEDADPTQTVIQACFTVEEDSFLDLEDHEIKNAAYSILKSKNVQPESRRELSRFWDYFYQVYETKLGNPIKLCNVRVSPPQNSAYPRLVLGNPSCLVARDTAVITERKIM